MDSWSGHIVPLSDVFKPTYETNCDITLPQQSCDYDN